LGGHHGGMTVALSANMPIGREPGVDTGYSVERQIYLLLNQELPAHVIIGLQPDFMGQLDF
jgi:hypothetical protein